MAASTVQEFGNEDVVTPTKLNEFISIAEFKTLITAGTGVTVTPGTSTNNTTIAVNFSDPSFPAVIKNTMQAGANVTYTDVSGGVRMDVAISLYAGASSGLKYSSGNTGLMIDGTSNFFQVGDGVIKTAAAGALAYSLDKSFFNGYQGVTVDSSTDPHRLIFKIDRTYMKSTYGYDIGAGNGLQWDTSGAKHVLSIALASSSGLQCDSSGLKVKVTDLYYQSGYSHGIVADETYPGRMRVAPSWVVDHVMISANMLHAGFSLLSTDGNAAKIQNFDLDLNVLAAALRAIW